MISSRFCLSQHIHRGFSTSTQKQPKILKAKSVQKVISIWSDLVKGKKTELQQWSKDSYNNREYPLSVKIPYPTGIGFRGQREIYKTPTLTPSAFREQDFIKEHALFDDFRLLHPVPKLPHRTTFDWLTLMQHYGVKTRLLDWTDSILKALYMVVENIEGPNKEKEDNADGEIWMLDAFKLNRHAALFPTDRLPPAIGVPWSFDVAIRAEMATSSNLEDLFRRRTVWQCDANDARTENLSSLFNQFLREGSSPSKEKEQFIKRLSYPFAVKPSMLNTRLKLQHGFFTIYGGKSYKGCSDKVPDELKPNHLPAYVSLDQLNNDLDGNKEEQFLLKVCKIDAEAKKSIREELFALGIHKESVYGELTDLGTYLGDKWSVRS